MYLLQFSVHDIDAWQFTGSLTSFVNMGTNNAACPSFQVNYLETITNQLTE